MLDSILSVPSHQPWKILKETLMRDYSEFKSPAHACTYLENRPKEMMSPCVCMCTDIPEPIEW